MSVREARRIAAEIIRKQAIVDVPVDVNVIAESFCIRILVEPMEESVSGMLVLREGRAAIGVNERHHPNRRRFTIGHELGHYLLHRDAATMFFDTSLTLYRGPMTTVGTDRREVEANAFAAALLMPEDILRRRCERSGQDLHDDHVLTGLAVSFGVSVQALTIRLVGLGIIA